MKFTPYPDRKTIFTKTVESFEAIHALIDKGRPWQNGFIERSNRTDKDEFFSERRFTSSEERKYLFQLWEMYYNTQRPHQGLNHKTPLEVFRQQYPYHATVWG